jgi:hypothetical protein
MSMVEWSWLLVDTTRGSSHVEGDSRYGRVKLLLELSSWSCSWLAPADAFAIAVLGLLELVVVERTAVADIG